MRVAHLTAGTGDFHCGACVRDHALVKALNQLGHDVSLVPLYLPFVSEEPDEHAERPVLLGAINVYLGFVSNFFRRRRRFLGPLLDSPALLRFASKRVGMTSAAKLGGMTFAMLQGDAGPQAAELERLIDYLGKTDKPDVVCLSNGLLMGVAGRVKAALNVPIVCSFQGEDTFLDALPDPWRGRCWSELQRCAADVDAFVAVSDYYRQVVRTRLNLPEDHTHTVRNGIDMAGFNPAASPPDPPAVGYMARLCHAKGLHTLVDAFVIMKKRDRVRDLKLRVAGTMTAPDKRYVKTLRAKLKRERLLDDVEIEANITRQRKQQFLRSLSVLSVPATYGEAFGLYVVEALASGVPFVQPDRGAFGELLAATGGGILTRSDDPADLADSIEQLLLDEPRRRELGERGRAAAVEHFSMGRMGRDFADVLEQCASRR